MANKKRAGRPIVGLVLGSGSARGLAHIGVIQAIRETGIPVDIVVGSSIGALVGAVYAAGCIDSLELSFRSFDWKKIGSLFDPVFPRSGLITGHKITEFVRAHIPVSAFEQLPVPFCAVAADMSTGERVPLCKGDLIEAVRASISVPGILTPVSCNGRLLVDGGLVDPVPVGAARALGANLVIAVDLNHDIVAGKRTARNGRMVKSPQGPVTRAERRSFLGAAGRIRNALRASALPSGARDRGESEDEPLPSMAEVLMTSLHIMQVRITEDRLTIDRPEVLLRPPLSSVHFLEFDRAGEMIGIGYRSAIGPLRDLASQLDREGRPVAHAKPRPTGVRSSRQPERTRKRA